MLIKRYYKKVIFFIALIAIFAGMYLIGKIIPEHQIRTIISESGIFGPIVYIILLLSTFIIAPPLSASPLYFAGYYAFGSNVVIFSLIATVFSSVVNFWIARYWGRGLVERFVGKKNVDKVDNLAKDYGFQMLFLLRVFQGGIADFVSYAAGLTSMKFVPYLIISMLGMLPAGILWYILAVKVQSAVVFTGLNVTLTIIFTVLLILLTFIYKKIKSRIVRKFGFLSFIFETIS